MATTNYTDPTISANITKTKKVHIDEIRTAITNLENAGGTPYDPSTGHQHTGGAADAPKLISTSYSDGSVSDAAIGTRTLNPNISGTSNTGTITDLFSYISKVLKGYSGANWYDVPSVSMSTLYGKFNASTGHKHTGAADDAPEITITVSPSIGTAESNTGTLYQLLSWIVKNIKSLKGTTNWYDSTTKSVNTLSSDLSSHTSSTHLQLGSTGTTAAAGNHTHSGTYEPANSYLVKTNTTATMTSRFVAQNSTEYTIGQVRNVYMSTTDPSGGGNGDIWIKYI